MNSLINFLKGPKFIIYITVILVCSFYLVFFLYPLMVSLLGSFTDWNALVGDFNFIGLDNYTRMLNDPVSS